jgi:hypothetical protein
MTQDKEARMELSSSKLVAFFAFVAAVGMGFGAYQVLSRHSPAAKTTRSGERVAAADGPEQPLVTRVAGGTRPSAGGSPRSKAPPAVNPQNSDYINQRFPHQIYPVVTMLPDLQRDDPEAYLALVRQHNPDYAKVLDDNARAEREAELTAAQQLREREQQLAAQAQRP